MALPVLLRGAGHNLCRGYVEGSHQAPFVIIGIPMFENDEPAPDRVPPATTRMPSTSIFMTRWDDQGVWCAQGWGNFLNTGVLLILLCIFNVTSEARQAADPNGLQVLPAP